MAEKNIGLKQRNSRGVDIQIKLIDGRELLIVTKGHKIKSRYSVDLLSLQDKSKEVIFIAWKWLIMCITIFLLTLFIIKILPTYLNENKNLYLGVILLAGFLGAGSSLIQFWKRTLKKKIFYSRNAYVPIIELRVGQPNKKDFDTFISKVERRIIDLRKHMNIAEEKQLIGEMKMLRRLSDESIISKKEYESAKVKLFSGFDSQVINRTK